jgi:hypothetical protein
VLLLQLLWSNRFKVVLLLLLGVLYFAWTQQGKIGELRGQINAKPSIAETKESKTTKGPVRITKTVTKPSGETSVTVTDRAPEVKEEVKQREETRVYPVVNENRRLVGLSLDPFNRQIAIIRIGYSFSNRIDFTYGYAIQANRHLLEVTLRF